MIARLGHLATEKWADLDGYAVAHNMPSLRRLPLERFCNFVWYMFTRNANDPAAVDKFRASLWMPPKGEVPPPQSPWSAENESKAFGALKAGLGIQPDPAVR